MKKIGILGGTFDPPHIGHLVIADEVQMVLNLDEVWFIPTYEPPHKSKAQTDFHDRLKMVALAIGSNEKFKLSDIEMNRKGKSYTIDTIHLLKEQYPNDHFYFIIGADMIEYLPQWHKIDELVKLITFVGVKRPGYEMKSFYPITEVSTPMIDISSSLIRKRLQEEKPVHYFVPKKVFSYIKENRLYEN